MYASSNFFLRKLPWSTPIIFAFLTMLLSQSGNLWAQSIQGSIVGNVQDTQGALVSGATVSLKNLSEGVIRTTLSNASGAFQFIDTKAGQYTIEVTRDGFEKWSTKNVELAVRRRLASLEHLPVAVRSLRVTLLPQRTG